MQNASSTPAARDSTMSAIILQSESVATRNFTDIHGLYQAKVSSRFPFLPHYTAWPGSDGDGPGSALSLPTGIGALNLQRHPRNRPKLE